MRSMKSSDCPEAKKDINNRIVEKYMELFFMIYVLEGCASLFRYIFGKC
jgi:hypothetical protein